MQRRTATRALYAVVAVLVLTGVVIVLLRSILLAQPQAADPFDAGFAQRPGLTLLHILPSLVFVLLGPLQFITRIRTRHVQLHRWCGRVYVASGIVVGVTAIALGVVIGFGGMAETTAVTFFSVLFLAFLGLAVYRIRQREVAAHREWMVRAFALGLAVATMRPMAAILLATTQLSFSEILGLSFWLAFSLHLVVAELWLRFTRARPALAIGPRPAAPDAPDAR